MRIETTKDEDTDFYMGVILDLGLPEEVESEAAQLFIYSADKTTNKRNLPKLAYGCVRYACRENAVPFAPNSLLDMFREKITDERTNDPRFEVLLSTRPKAYDQVYRIFGPPDMPPPVDYVKKIGERLGLGDGTVKRAVEMTESAEVTNGLKNMDNRIAGAVVLDVVTQEEGSSERNRMAEEGVVSKTTLVKHSKRIRYVTSNFTKCRK